MEGRHCRIETFGTCSNLKDAVGRQKLREPVPTRWKDNFLPHMWTVMYIHRSKYKVKKSTKQNQSYNYFKPAMVAHVYNLSTQI